jgi:hypothetical protein
MTTPIVSFVLFSCALITGTNSASLQAEFKRNNGLVYISNALGRDDALLVKNAVSKLKNTVKKETGSIATGRFGCHIPQSNVCADILLSSAFCSRIKRVTEKEFWPADFPLELRVYPIGAFMPMHRDECLYKEPQIEFIYTVENSSDSKLQYVDIDGKLHVEWTQPNSLVLVRADASEHGVTPITRGSRTIVKGLFTMSDEKSEAYARAMATYNKAGSTTNSKNNISKKTNNHHAGKGRKK